MAHEPHHSNDIDPEETRDWVESIEAVIKKDGPDRAQYILNQVLTQAGISTKGGAINTPYVNTIPPEDDPEYPGDEEIERRITDIVRWNAMVMVLKANNNGSGVGGHISTFASSAVLYEVGHNHFFKGPRDGHAGDQVFFQGHASPGVYARAFTEGRLPAELMDNFRRELAPGGGLPSYPHPRLQPDFWQYPTVSMGIGPLTALYLARFYRYLEHRGLKDTSSSNVYAFLGDGELDEPESLGLISLAAREGLDNLIFVVNCNLQRLDGPVRGNGQIVQETEGIFRGAGWDVVKVLWGEKWDPVFAKDTNGALKRLLENTVDGEFQNVSTMDGKTRLREYFSKDPEALKCFEGMTDEEVGSLERGGHDYLKVYAAYDRAVNKKNGKPTVIIAKTVKGYGMGESGEGRNIAHQQKKMSDDSIKGFLKRFPVPVPENQVADLPYYLPKEGSPEKAYLDKIRDRLGPMIPSRTVAPEALPPLEDKHFERALKGSGERTLSTTKAYVQVLSNLLRDKKLGKYFVPIIPDEARTFGMEGLFRQYRIYSSKGQLYKPVDSSSLMPYKESKDGQILQEGISEAGSMCSFIAAGTSYAYLGVNMIPFYAYYSMFGFQRVGDFIWAASDMKARGFLMGGTAGRTTLNGEGLQHEDGHSLILASTFPNIMAYDPAFEYEMAVIIQDGIQRMHYDGDDVFYYLTMYNEDYAHPAIPEGVKEGIKQGMYCFRRSTSKAKEKVHLVSSGVTLKDAIKAAEILEKDFGLAVDIWSAPSFKRLREDTLLVEHENALNPGKKAKTSYLQDLLSKESGLFVAVTDHMRSLPEMIRQWVPGEYEVLGTDGFGRSSSREELRRYFEIDAESIIWRTLHKLSTMGKMDKKIVSKAMKDFGITPDKAHGLHIASEK